MGVVIQAFIYRKYPVNTWTRNTRWKSTQKGLNFSLQTPPTCKATLMIKAKGDRQVLLFGPPGLPKAQWEGQRMCKMMIVLLECLGSSVVAEQVPASYAAKQQQMENGTWCDDAVLLFGVWVLRPPAKSCMLYGLSGASLTARA